MRTPIKVPIFEKKDMRTASAILGLCLLSLGSCKETPKTEPRPAEGTEPPATLLEQLAEKHGYDNWKDVRRIRFTFNIDRDTLHMERAWTWDVRENRVTLETPSDTITYLRTEVDSVLAKTDGAFINDKYWFLAPYQWVWDSENITHEYLEETTAPISGETMAKLSIVYGAEGGYTPGDAYDFYFGKDSVVREWVFRRGNQPEPTLATTWEGYRDVNGLLLSTEHQNAEGTFKLYFTDIRVD